MRKKASWVLPLLLAALPAGCGGPPENAGRELVVEPGSAAAPLSAAEWSGLVRNGRVPMEGVLTGGQPTDAQLAALRDAGFATVINLRQPDERGTRGEAEKVAALGMEYVAIPVDGSRGLTKENARLVAAALEESERPLLLHCGSGNRVGALLALEAFWLDGVGAEEALAIGEAAGLTRLEPAVRELMARRE